MSAAIDALIAAYRLYKTEGVPATGENEPDKNEIRAAFARLGIELDALTAAQAGGMLSYETKALLDADTSQDDGTRAYVWGDETAENNTFYLWDDDGAAWVEDTDFLALITGPAGADGNLSPATGEEVAAGTLNDVVVTPKNLNESGLAASIVPEAPESFALFHSPDDYVVMWMEDLQLAFPNGLEATTLAKVAQQLGLSVDSSGIPLATDGRKFRTFRGAISSLLHAASSTATAHLLLLGDSWTERWVIPQAIRDDFTALGVPIVATGWISVAATGKSNGNISPQLLGDDDELTVTSGFKSDITDGSLTGNYGPDGYRHTFDAADTTAQITLAWTGKSVSFYFEKNAATLRHVTDGGANNDVTLDSGGGVQIVTITAAGEGQHTTTITRPTATNDLIWYGAFAASELPGLMISKMGNGGSKAHNFEGIIDAATATTILADIAPTAVRISFLTNEARDSTPTATFTAGVQNIIDAVRAANAAAEIYFAVPLANGLAGISSGVDIATYIPELFNLARENDMEVVNHHSFFPLYADSFDAWADTQHLAVAGSFQTSMAERERNLLWSF